MKTKIAFWLVPSISDRKFFQQIIEQLAKDYDAPNFTPHVTIYFGEYAPDESVVDILEQAVRGVTSFSLTVDKILYTEQYTKTLFVQFQPNEILTEICNKIRQNSQIPNDYVLNPHLSLIYKHLDEETKKNLANAIALPSSEVFFDEFQIISSPEKVEKREDVNVWELLHVKNF